MLEEKFDQIDEEIGKLEQQVSSDNQLDLPALLNASKQLVSKMLTSYAEAKNKEVAENDDLLLVFKVFVKGDPSLNAVRDNVREIVYYQNCLAENREDALPSKPEKMLAHTVRHIYLYLRSRCEQENLFEE